MYAYIYSGYLSSIHAVVVLQQRKYSASIEDPRNSAAESFLSLDPPAKRSVSSFSSSKLSRVSQPTKLRTNTQATQMASPSLLDLLLSHQSRKR